MKKIFFILFVCIFCLQLPGFSQKSRVGVTGGMTISNMTDTFRVANKTGSSKYGFKLGMFMDIPLGKSRFTFQPGVDYVQKGKVLEKTKAKKTSIGLRYAELQLNFIYNTKGAKGNFFAGAGPAFSFGLPSKQTTKIGSVRSSANISFGNDATDAYNGIDYGVNFTAGYKLKCGFFVAANYTLGIRNIVSNENSDNKVRNGCFGLSAGFLVNNK